MNLVPWLLTIVCMLELTTFTYGQSTTENGSIRFVDVSESSGLNFRHQDGGTGERYLPEHMGAGIASFDADADGLLDIYFLNGARLPDLKPSVELTDRFFRNRDGKAFDDFTVAAGLTELSYSLGVTVGDYDNDGFQDLYVSNFGKNRMFRNNGDGTFTDSTDACGVGDGNKFSAGATFLDADCDGDLEIFVGNYVSFDFDRHRALAPTAFPYSPGPRDFPAVPDSLFLNNGDGTFRDVSHDAGIDAIAGPSMGVVSADFDGDGDIDIFVACDGEANLLYVNDGSGHFTEEGILTGVGLDSRGVANGSMGVDVADVNGDALLDLLVTNYSDQLPELFFNQQPGGVFEESSRATQIGSEVLPHVNWGLGLVDLDCDGDKDAFICNGHLLENAKEIEPQTDFGVRNTIMENLASRSFRSASEAAGPALLQARSSRGAAFDDLNLDGRIDAVILNSDSFAQTLYNTTANQNHWMMIDLVGTSVNRDAIGAKVWLYTGNKVQFTEKVNGRGYQSHCGATLHFGLGKSARVDRVEIQWPGIAQKQVLNNLDVNQRLKIVQ
jgi:enediyne biosynthesis protein E4